MLCMLKGIVHIDVDQQDYLGVLLCDPNSFGSSAGSNALKATPADKGRLKSKSGLELNHLARSCM